MLTKNKDIDTLFRTDYHMINYLWKILVSPFLVPMISFRHLSFIQYNAQKHQIIVTISCHILCHIVYKLNQYCNLQYNAIFLNMDFSELKGF